ncbi:hypothetical protein D3C77_34490 [compost metagenome]
MSNISLNDNVSIVLAALGRCALPHQFAVVGGFARDVKHGVMPKDIDVAVVGHVSVADIIRAMSHAGYANEGNVPCESEGADATRWAYILQFSSPNKLDVDILISARNEDLLTCVANNDYNLNQYIMFNGQPMFVGKREGILHLSRNSQVTEERKQYIEQKARDLGWIVPVTPTAEEA